MAPSFFDPGSSSSSLFTTGASGQSAASANNLPTLSVVLGLIGALFAMIFVAGICIYIFRRRLFPPPTEPIDDEEKTRTQSKREAADPDRSSYFSDVADDGMVSHEEVGRSMGSRPDLRPFLLNPVRPVRSFYAARPVEGYAKLSTLRVSLSCPARLGQIKNTFDDAASSFKGIELPPKVELEDPTLVSRLSPPRSLFVSFDSSGSFYSQESNCSSDSSDPSDSLSWDYYINNPHEDLFYNPEPLSSPVPSSPGPEEVSFTMTVRGQLEQESGVNFHGNFISPPKRLRNTLSKRASSNITTRRREFYSCKANSQAVLQALKIHILRSRAARCASARLDSPRSRFSDTTVSSESLLDNNSFSDDPFVLKPDSQALSPPTTQVSAVKPSDAHLSQTSFRSFSRQPLGVITNTHTASNEGNASMYSNTSLEGNRETSAVRPSFLLNDVPTRDLTTTTPPRFNRLKSPPRNPALLNTRWMPRPDIPPLRITIFVKDRCNFNLSYLGRRITLTPTAGTSLAELRESIERKLGRDVRMLRGMVFIGSRSMFLPLATQNFYVQWVKERVRDGGIGIVEAWLH